MDGAAGADTAGEEARGEGKVDDVAWIGEIPLSMLVLTGALALSWLACLECEPIAGLFDRSESMSFPSADADRE